MKPAGNESAAPGCGSARDRPGWRHSRYAGPPDEWLDGLPSGARPNRLLGATEPGRRPAIRCEAGDRDPTGGLSHV
jgi:hypothetical protein